MLRFVIFFNLVRFLLFWAIIGVLLLDFSGLSSFNFFTASLGYDLSWSLKNAMKYEGHFGISSKIGVFQKPTWYNWSNLILSEYA